MSKVDHKLFNKCFEYDTSNEVAILTVDDGNDGTSDDQKVAYDSDDHLFWIKDYVKGFKFKDGNRIMTAFYDRLVASDHDEWVA